MNKSLWKKSIRDIWKNKVQLVLITVLLIIAISLSAGLKMAGKNLVDREMQMKEDSQFADLYITLDSACTDEEVNEILDANAIDTVARRRSIEAVINMVPSKYVRVVDSAFELNKPLLFDGSLDIGGNSAIINHGFYRLQDDLSIGDTLEIKNGTLKKEIRVVGSFNTPEYLQGAHEDFFRADYAVIYVSPDTFDALDGGDSASYELLVKVGEGSTKKEAMEILVATLGNKIQNSYNSEELYSQKTFYDVVIRTIFHTDRLFLLTFILVIVFFVTIISVTRLVGIQRKTIGVMKILGYSKNQIIMNYMVIGMGISLVSAIIGLYGSIQVSDLVTNYYCGIFDFMQASNDYTLSNYIPTACLCVLVVCLATFIAARKTVSIRPIELLRKNASIRIHNESFLEKFYLWRKVSIVGRNALRVIGGRPIRFLSAVLVTLLGSTLLLMLFNFIEQDTYMEKQDKRFLNYDGSVILRQPLEAEELHEFIEQLAFDSYQLNYEDKTSASFAGNELELDFTVTENTISGNLPGGTPMDMDREGVYLSDAAARSLGISEGEKIDFLYNGTKMSFEVSKIFSYYRNYILVSEELMQSQTSNAIQYNYIHFNLSGEDSKGREEIEKAVNSYDYAIGMNFQDEMWEQVANSNRLTFIIYYGLVALVVLLNMYVLILLNRGTYAENATDMAIMRVLGIDKLRAGAVMNWSLIGIFLSICFFTLFVLPVILQILFNRVLTGLFYKTAISFGSRLYTVAILFVIYLILNWLNNRRVSALVLNIKE